MKKKFKITSDEINCALADIKSPTYMIYYKLGGGLLHEYAPPEVRFCADYQQIGKSLWTALSYELYPIICNTRNHQPKAWVNELISGDIRDVLVGIIAAISSTFSVGLGIAIPAAALVIKKGLIKYCSINPKNSRQETVKSILAREKRSWNYLLLIHKKSKTAKKKHKSTKIKKQPKPK
jgi:hypothetical protein